MTEFSFFLRVAGMLTKNGHESLVLRKRNRRSIRLASELIQRAKSGALVFGASLRMTEFSFFLRVAGMLAKNGHERLVLRKRTAGPFDSHLN
jgi:hypothetical protein